MVIEDIVLFDMEDVNIKEEIVIKKDLKILIINSDYASFFPISVALKKEDFVLTYCKSFAEAYDLLKEKYDLIIVFEESNMEISEFIEFCEVKDLKKIIISSNIDVNNEDYLEKKLVKNELFNKIINYIGK